MVSSSETRLKALFAQMHQDEVDRKAMQPGGEGGLAAEAADLAEEMEEGLLGHVLGFGDVAEHAKAEGVDAAFVQGVELGKCLGVAVLGGFDGFGFAGDGRIALEEAWGRVSVLVICRPWMSMAQLRVVLISATLRFASASAYRKRGRNFLQSSMSQLG